MNEDRQEIGRNREVRIKRGGREYRWTKRWKNIDGDRQR